MTRPINCVLFGESFDLPWPTNWPLPDEEPYQLTDIEVSYHFGTKFFKKRANGTMCWEIPLNDEGDDGRLWREGWHRLRQPDDLILRGTIGFRAFKLLRLYAIGADSGATELWHDALLSGTAGWRDLEKSRPDLLSVPKLMLWKESMLNSGQNPNRHARPKGSSGLSPRLELDLHAVNIRAAEKKYGRRMSLAQAARRACAEFPELLVGSLDDMIARLEKGKPQGEWKKFQRSTGRPPTPKRPG